MKRKKIEITAFGYTKEEDGIYTAICINMSLFGQGKTPEEALKKVIKAIDSYINFVLEKHPNERKKYLYRPAPANLIREYKQGIKNLEKLMESKRYQARQPYKFIPERTFVETASFAQA